MWEKLIDPDFGHKVINLNNEQPPTTTFYNLYNLYTLLLPVPAPKKAYIKDKTGIW